MCWKIKKYSGKSKQTFRIFLKSISTYPFSASDLLKIKVFFFVKSNYFLKKCFDHINCVYQTTKTSDTIRWILSVFFRSLKYMLVELFFRLHDFGIFSYFLNLSSAEMQLSMVYNWLLWLNKITSDGNLKWTTKHTIQFNKLKLICKISYFNGTPYIT